MVMQSMRGGAVGGLLKYVLMGMLGLAVGGLVIMDVRGVYSGGGLGNGDVAKVGDETIDMREFDRGLRQAIARYNVDVQTAYKLGLVQEVLSGEIRKRMMSVKAKELDLRISDKVMAERIAGIIKPYKNDGETLQQAFDRVLKSSGLSEQAFVSTVENEMIANLLLDSLHLNVSPYSGLLAEDLVAFQNHTRNISAITFKDSEVELEVEPSDEQLQAMYESLKHTEFKIPEYRDVQLAVFTPNADSVDITVSEDEVRRYYDENQDLYMLDKQVVITQAVFKDKGSADDALEKLQTGAPLEDVSGDNARLSQNVPFEISGLLPVIAEAIEGKDTGYVTPIIETPLGYHIVRLDGRLEKRIKEFDEVKASILSELEGFKKDDLLYERLVGLENNALDGQSFDELVGYYPEDMNVFKFGFIDALGNNKSGDVVVQSDALEKASEILQLTFDIDTSDTRVFVSELDNGDYIFIDVKAVEASSFRTFEDVEEIVREKFTADLLHAENSARVQNILSELSLGGVTLQSVAKEHAKGITNYDDVLLSGELPEGFTAKDKEKLINTDIGDFAMLEGDGYFTIVTPTDYTLPEAVKQEQIDRVAESLNEELKEGVFLSFLDALVNKYKVQVNDKLLERLYADKNSMQ